MFIWTILVLSRDTLKLKLTQLKDDSNFFGTAQKKMRNYLSKTNKSPSNLSVSGNRFESKPAPGTNVNSPNIT